MTEIGYDAKKMPLGKLTKAHIQKVYWLCYLARDVFSVNHPF
jgi:hypothetical protein